MNDFSPTAGEGLGSVMNKIKSLLGLCRAFHATDVPLSCMAEQAKQAASPLGEHRAAPRGTESQFKTLCPAMSLLISERENNLEFTVDILIFFLWWFPSLLEETLKE